MLHTPTILIADEELAFISSLAGQVRKAGLHFLAETSPEMALDLARTHRPDLVVLDIYQPLGRTLLSWLKEDPFTLDLKVLVLTDFEGRDEDLGSSCLELGAHEFDLKPADFTVVDKIVRLAWGAGNPASAANDAQDAEEPCVAS